VSTAGPKTKHGKRQSGKKAAGRLSGVRKARRANAAIGEFVRKLNDKEIMLLRLRDELYGGRWDIMLGDLNDRLQGRPYIFKLASRIQDDIERIQRLSRFEREQGVDLARFV